MQRMADSTKEGEREASSAHSRMTDSRGRSPAVIPPATVLSRYDGQLRVVVSMIHRGREVDARWLGSGTTRDPELERFSLFLDIRCNSSHQYL